MANDQGNRTTPSYVAFTDSERLIGDAAKNQVSMNPENEVRIVQEGGLPPLIALLRSTEARIQSSASIAIRNLSVNSSNQIGLKSWST
jgi:hypothetical protein